MSDSSCTSGSRRSSEAAPERGDGPEERLLDRIAAFYDTCKVGHQGGEGFRKSTDLFKLGRCLRALFGAGILDPAETIFADLGCADGRVNVLASYFVKASIGIEIDPDILAEYRPRRRALFRLLEKEGLAQPPENVHLFAGSSLDPALSDRMREEAGVGFEEVDLFYTYITLHDLFAERIAREAKEGALYLVYGFHQVLPRYEGLELLDPDVAGQRIAALFGKGRGR